MSAKKTLTILSFLGILCLLALTPGSTRAASPLFGAFLISDQAADITHSAIAYNTQDHVYLVVWCHQQTGSVGVFARTVNEKGQLGPVYPVSDISGDKDRCDPDVAYDSRHNNYLVVWQEKVGSSITVHGKLFSPGSFQSSDIAFFDSGTTSSAATSPAVDYAYWSDDFGVVWACWPCGGSGTSSIYGQRLNYDGNKIGANVLIAAGSGSVSAYDPDLAYNQARYEYLVVFTRLDTNAPNGPNKDIFGWRLAPDLQKQGGEIKVSFLTPQEHSARVAALSTSAPESGRYLVAYQVDFYTNAQPPVFLDNDIWGQIVFGNGAVMFPGAYFVINGTDAYETNPAVAASPASRDFLVAWSSSPPPHGFTGIQSRTVYPDSKMVSSNWLGGFFADFPSVAAGQGGDYLVAAEDTSLFGNRDLYGILLGNRVYIPIARK